MSKKKGKARKWLNVRKDEEEEVTIRKRISTAMNKITTEICFNEGKEEEEKKTMIKRKNNTKVNTITKNT